MNKNSKQFFCWHRYEFQSIDQNIVRWKCRKCNKSTLENKTTNAFKRVSTTEEVILFTAVLVLMVFMVKDIRHGVGALEKISDRLEYINESIRGG